MELLFASSLLKLVRMGVKMLGPRFCPSATGTPFPAFVLTSHEAEPPARPIQKSYRNARFPKKQEGTRKLECLPIVSLPRKACLEAFR